MEGSRISNPAKLLSIVLFGCLGAAMMAVCARAAEPDSAAVGAPTPLFTPAPTTPTGSAGPTTPTSPAPPSAAASPPARKTTAASPGRHPATPVQRAPLDARPLIPPASLPARISPPPEPRPALPLETDLQPTTPPGASAPQAPGAAGDAAPAAAKPPSS